MSVEEIRSKASILQAKLRRNLIIAVVLGLVLLVLCIIAIVRLPYTPPRVIAAIMMVVISAIVDRAYRRVRSPETVSSDAVISACIEFYRKELETEYRSFAVKWRLLVPIVFYVWLTWNSWARSTIVLRFVLPSFLILMFFLRHREARKLKHELDALNAFEKENASSS